MLLCNGRGPFFATLHHGHVGNEGGLALGFSVREADISMTRSVWSGTAPPVGAEDGFVQCRKLGGEWATELSHYCCLYEGDGAGVVLVLRWRKRLRSRTVATVER